MFPFFFFFGRNTQHAGSYFPDQGLNLHSLQWKCRILTEGMAGKSLFILFFDPLLYLNKTLKVNFLTKNLKILKIFSLFHYRPPLSPKDMYCSLLSSSMPQTLSSYSYATLTSLTEKNAQPKS